MKKSFYSFVLLIIFSFTSFVNGQITSKDDVNSVPLIANCEESNTKAGRLSCIRNAVGGVVKYIDIDKVVHEDFSERIYVKLELKISEIGDISLEKVVHDNSKIRKIITKAFNIWKRNNKVEIVKPAQKNGENTSTSLVLPLIFYGADY